MAKKYLDLSCWKEIELRCDQRDSKRQSPLPAPGSPFSNAVDGSDAASAGDPGRGALDTDEKAEEPAI
jgi:hypothetical protein